MAFGAHRVVLSAVPVLLHETTSLPASVWIVAEAGGRCLVGGSDITQENGQHVQVETPTRYDIPKHTEIYGLAGPGTPLSGSVVSVAWAE
jgi:hypothetical protein